MTELMHAYVDGELNELERIRFERRMAADPALAEEVAALRALKRQVQETYGVTPDVPRKEASRPVRRGGAALRWVAVWLTGVALGLLGGWQLEQVLPAHQSGWQQLAAQGHVILHIDRDDPARLNKLMETADRLAREGVRVTVVANAEAVRLFSVGHSPDPQGIERLVRNDHVSLVVCRRALQNMARRGIHLTPLPAARSDVFALDYIVRHVEQGWRYQKI